MVGEKFWWINENILYFLWEVHTDVISVLVVIVHMSQGPSEADVYYRGVCMY